MEMDKLYGLANAAACFVGLLLFIHRYLMWRALDPGNRIANVLLTASLLFFITFLFGVMKWLHHDFDHYLYPARLVAIVLHTVAIFRLFRPFCPTMIQSLLCEPPAAPYDSSAERLDRVLDEVATTIPTAIRAGVKIAPGEKKEGEK